MNIQEYRENGDHKDWRDIFVGSDRAKKFSPQKQNIGSWQVAMLPTL